MSDQELKSLLARLHRELESTDKVGPETLTLVRQLDSDIHKLVESSSPTESFDAVIDSASSLKNRFAAEHPVAERYMAEIVDTLAKIGI